MVSIGQVEASGKGSLRACCWGRRDAGALIPQGVELSSCSSFYSIRFIGFLPYYKRITCSLWENEKLRHTERKLYKSTAWTESSSQKYSYSGSSCQNTWPICPRTLLHVERCCLGQLSGYTTIPVYSGYNSTEIVNVLHILFYYYY